MALTATVQHLAERFRLPTAFLNENGVHDALSEWFVGVAFYYAAEAGLRGSRTPFPVSPRYHFRLSIDGADKWRWETVEGHDGEIVAYGQHRLGMARESGELILVEGESDCLCAWFHGVTALGIPGASMSRVLEREHAEGIDRMLVHREPGNGGRKFVEGVTRRLAEIGYAGNVRVFDLAAHGVEDVAELHVDDPDRFEERLRESIDAGQRVDLELRRPVARRESRPRSFRASSPAHGDFQRAKAAIDIADVLDAVCVERRGNRWRSPWGGGMTVTACTNRGIFTCWSSGARGDVVALCMAAYGDTFNEAIDRLGLPSPYGRKGEPDEPIDERDFGTATALQPAAPRQYEPPAVCPRSTGMVLQDGNATQVVGAHALAPCRTRSCGYCGPIWEAGKAEHLAGNLEEHSGPVWAERITGDDWTRIRRRLNRAKADWVRVVTDDHVLILSTARVSEQSVDVTAERALGLFERALRRAPLDLRKPLAWSRSWNESGERSEVGGAKRVGRWTRIGVTGGDRSIGLEVAKAMRLQTRPGEMAGGEIALDILLGADEADDLVAFGRCCSAWSRWVEGWSKWVEGDQLRKQEQREPRPAPLNWGEFHAKWLGHVKERVEADQQWVVRWGRSTIRMGWRKVDTPEVNVPDALGTRRDGLPRASGTTCEQKASTPDRPLPSREQPP